MVLESLISDQLMCVSAMLICIGKDLLGSGNTEYSISTNTSALFTSYLEWS